MNDSNTSPGNKEKLLWKRMFKIGIFEMIFYTNAYSKTTVYENSFDLTNVEDSVLSRLADVRPLAFFVQWREIFISEQGKSFIVC